MTREERFTRIVRRLMTKHNLTVMEVAERIDVSCPTVRRWIEGVNQPHPLMWKHVFKALRENPPEET